MQIVYLLIATYLYCKYSKMRERITLKENPESEQQQVTNRENRELTYPNGLRFSVSVGCELNLIRELILIL